MKKRFFKKLKKYILVLSCILSCLVILSLPVQAASSDLLNSLINNGTLRVEGTSFGIPGLNGSHASGEVVFKTLPVLNLIENHENIEQTNSIFYYNSREISDRLDFTTSSNSILLKKGSSFEGVIYGFAINWIVEVSDTLGFIWLKSDVDISCNLIFWPKGSNNYTTVKIDDFFYSSENGGYLSFNCPYVPIDCSRFMIELIYNPSDLNLVDERSKMPLSHFIHQLKVVTHQFQIIDFKIDFSSTVPPLSEQPIYSEPSNGSTSELEGLESEIIGSTNSQASERTENLFGAFFDTFDNFSVSISAFRDAFNFFVNSNVTIKFIVTVTLITGIILLFSNFPINRGGSK